MSTTASSGTFAPDPGAAPLRRMLAAQAGLEVRMVLRNGEQLLLTLVIPVLVLTVFGSVEVMDLGDRAARVDFLVPGVLALAVHVDRLHRAGDRHRVRAAATACSSGSAPHRCRAGRCWRPRAWRC